MAWTDYSVQLGPDDTDLTDHGVCLWDVDDTLVTDAASESTQDWLVDYLLVKAYPSLDCEYN